MSGIYEMENDGATETQGLDEKKILPQNLLDPKATAEIQPETKATIDGWWDVSCPAGSAIVCCQDESRVPELFRTLYLLDSHIPIVVTPATKMPSAGEDAIYEQAGKVFKGSVADIEDWIKRRESKMQIQ